MNLIGTSLIAFGIVSAVLALVDSGFDCGAFLLILAGFAVRNGMRWASLCGIVLSVYYLFVALSVVVAAAAHGVVEVGVYRLVLSLALAIWAWLNWILLSGLRAQSQVVVTDELPASRGPSWRFQFTLRSMFVLTIIVALACWAGTRPLSPDDHWEQTSSSSSNAGAVMWSVGAVGYRSGRLATGYIWRSEGRTPSTPTRIRIQGDRSDGYRLIVDDVPIAPAEEFQLFVNDAEGNPICLRISQEDAAKLFGRPVNQPRIEQFWKDVVITRRNRLSSLSQPESSRPRN